MAVVAIFHFECQTKRRWLAASRPASQRWRPPNGFQPEQAAVGTHTRASCVPTASVCVARAARGRRRPAKNTQQKTRFSLDGWLYQFVAVAVNLFRRSLRRRPLFKSMQLASEQHHCARPLASVWLRRPGPRERPARHELETVDAHWAGWRRRSCDLARAQHHITEGR
jgi:hypothetical protein